MTTIYITRHGETVWNIEGRMQGWNDSPLTDLGIVQAEWLHDRIKDIEFNAIYSSPSGRAFKTAEILKGNRDVEVIRHDAFREINLCRWEGLNQEEIKALDKEQSYNFWNAPHLYNPFEGENFEEVRNRVHKALLEIVQEHKDEKVLIVTHTMTLKSLMSCLQNKSSEFIWEPPFIKQTSLTILEFDEENMSISMHADASHHKYSHKEYNENK